MPIQSPFISIIGDCDSGNCDPGSCSNASPRANFDLQVLEGIQLDKIAPSTKAEYPRAIKMIRAKEALAIKLVTQEVKMRLRKSYEFRDVIDEEITGRFNKADYDVMNGITGVEVRNWSCDPYTKVKLGWIEIKTNAPFSKDFHIIQGCNVTTTCIDLACGINRIELNLEDSERIAVLAEFCGEELSSLSWCGEGNDFSCVKDYVCNCACLNIRGITDTDPVSDQVIDPLEEFEPATLYFRTCGACVADVDELFCKYWEVLELAILYRLGVLIMLEQMHSTSLSPVIRNTRDSARDLLMQWYGGIDAVAMIERRGDYWNLIDQAVVFFENILSNTNTKIIKCTGNRIHFALPA